MVIKTKYKSSLFMIIIPSIMAIITIGGIIYTGFFIFKIEKLWQSLILIALTMIAVVIVLIVTYPIINKIAGFRKGLLGIDKNILYWKTGSPLKKIDLTQRYSLEIYSGEALAGLGEIIKNTLLTFKTEELEINITLRHSNREDILSYFNEDNFLFDYSFTPESGMASFDLSLEDKTELDIFNEILTISWENRNNNIAYNEHKKFPWDHNPPPESSYTFTLNSLDSEDNTKITEIKKAAFLKYHGRLFCTGDYIMVTMDSSMKDLFTALTSPNNLKDYFLCMPVGNSKATVVEESMASGGSSNTMKVQRLGITSKDSQGKDVSVKLNMPKPGFNNIENLSISTLMRFLDKKQLNSK